MTEKIEELEKIAALFRKYDEDPSIVTDGRELELAVRMMLARLVKRDGEIIAGVSGDAYQEGGSIHMQLLIASVKGYNYLMVFPDTKSAAEAKAGFTLCKAEELLRHALETEQIRGIVMPISRDGDNIVTAEITKPMAYIALNS